eukprot:CAMPEP_0206487676 /NCGR_PEP_ID=MMETSP0324_2-20121206/41814_1 /ASSEMBLY_ACC=CAM_ASM_000836 /TAXON_ID=2866 /ORGANISM="Crypthecodinium cohnii, Strain Seligo" /LENGTH=698 /DNA_ID=CAMNT_0053966265 /DNA_START=115 /DNA_END=2211 /DNA_ORIENTATION=+
MPSAPNPMATVSFSHVHLYVDKLRELEEYKKLETKLNAFVKAAGDDLLPLKGRMGADTEAGRKHWQALEKEFGQPCTGASDPASWKGQRQDIVEQALIGLGWRVTGVCETASTRSLVLTSADSNGVRMVVTAHKTKTMEELGEQGPAAKRSRSDVQPLSHFNELELQRFSALRANREGIAVLGFSVASGGLENIFQNYKALHPKLLHDAQPRELDGAKVLEVYAYYKGEKSVSDADEGTLLRFVEEQDSSKFWVLPGVKQVDATFDEHSAPAYCDHWVSNVISRTGFLDTLNETLGFTPKVDFNAGVVAAGEAQIESTVTGNDPNKKLEDASVALVDQSQVYLPTNNALSEVGHVHLYLPTNNALSEVGHVHLYLPTNNALSEVGHVHLYLQEIGQGIQHIASRTFDLPKLVQQANDFRKMTGAGLAFLTIPRSYYGTLTAKWLSKVAEIEMAEAEKYTEALKKAGLVDLTNIMSMDATPAKVAAALPAGTPASIVDWCLKGRYSNMYALLGDHIGEATYLKVLQNNILVDVQGDDLLMQIFTCTVLQREAGQEAPFLEFIQRVCSEKIDPKTGKPKAMKPGCGGFGIRNFLTLFLSIEVSKASKAKADAELEGRMEAASYYASMVKAFTDQLDESNPILTGISDAMTAEGEALDEGDEEAAKKWAEVKAQGQQELMKVSSKYKTLMKNLRDKAPPGC